jgi:ATP-dependent phosphoenolpyruvate carboxykinase
VEALLVRGDGLLPAVAKLNDGRYLLKAGRVGGPEGSTGSLAISDDLVARVLDATVAGEVEWETDPDFAYEVAASVRGIEPPEDGLLMPRLLYARADRPYEHAAEVARLRDEVARLIAP